MILLLLLAVRRPVLERMKVRVPYPPVAPFSHLPLPSGVVVRPMIFPIVGHARWGRHYNNDRPYNRHTGIDIAAPKMSPIVASFSGVLGFKRNTYWINGARGWIILGTHLNDDSLGTHDNKGDRDVMFAPNVYPGMKVKAGQFIGYVGESGNATGPHLHFELYVPGKGSRASRIRDPFYSLRISQVLKKPRIQVPHPKERPGRNEYRLEVCLRGVFQDRNAIRVILLAKQTATSPPVVVTYPHFLTLSLSKSALKSLGGWSGLRSIPDTRAISLFVPWRKGLDHGAVERALPVAPS